jgi:hypothetical protein
MSQPAEPLVLDSRLTANALVIIEYCRKHTTPPLYSLLSISSCHLTSGVSRPTVPFGSDSRSFCRGGTNCQILTTRRHDIASLLIERKALLEPLAAAIPDLQFNGQRRATES